VNCLQSRRRRSINGRESRESAEDLKILFRESTVILLDLFFNILCRRK